MRKKYQQRLKENRKKMKNSPRVAHQTLKRKDAIIERKSTIIRELRSVARIPDVVKNTESHKLKEAHRKLLQ